MVRKVFFSFHYELDSWRAGQVRNMGKLNGNAPVADNDWEDIKGQEYEAIKKWIDDQINGTSCAIVLIGSRTAGRKWVEYEIKEAWDRKKGVLGIYIHNLENQFGKQTTKGENPFIKFNVKDTNLASIVKTYEPPDLLSKNVYCFIKDNIADWVEKAIHIRNQYEYELLR